MTKKIQKKIANKLSLMIMFALIGTITSFAQTSIQTGQATGKLLDETGKPMMYATVSLLNAKDSSLVQGAITNDNGVYTLNRVKVGTYVVKAGMIGYKNVASDPFDVGKNSQTVVVPNITMQPMTRALSVVNITSVKPLVEQKPDRIVVNVANSVLAAGNSAMDILERVPGVTIDKDDNISLRGKQGVTVMINDKLTYLSTAQLATLLRSTDGNTIQSIEIITNPSAKYDATGNSGIINIKLKKNRQTGTNGSVTLGAGYGNYGKDNETLQLNHKDGNLNLFGSFSHNDDKRTKDIGVKRIVGDTTYFRETSPLIGLAHNNSYRLGADYQTSAKNTVGVVVNGYFNTENDAVDSHNYIGRNFTQADSSLHTVSEMDQTYHNYAVNLNDVLKIDSAGQQISADLDYSKFNNGLVQLYTTDFFLADGSQQHPQAFLGNIAPSNIDIRSAKVDYTNPLTKSIKIETGLKLSDVKTDNNLLQATESDAQYLNANHFIYDEKIDAGYLNLNKEFKNTSVQLGLRAEYTQSDARADSMGVLLNIPRNYLDLFPSASINHTFDEKNEANFTYGRRIDRPQYDNLNPFVFRLDPYTYQKGNPYLRPQYTNNFGIGYTYNKSINITLGYSHTADVITDLPGIDPATKVSFITQGNLQQENAYNLNIFTPFTVTRWWDGNVNATAFYLAFKSDNLEGADLDRGKAAYAFSTTQTITPLAGFKAELSGTYRSALTYALFYVKPQYWVDAGVSHSFAEKKANIKFSVSDIFNTHRNDVDAVYAATNMAITQKSETRIARLTLTYNFGSNKVTEREHQSGADDLQQRVKGNN